MLNAWAFKWVPKIVTRHYKMMLLIILTSWTIFIVANNHYKKEVVRDTYNDDVAPEVFDKVFQRWYNSTGIPKWYNSPNVSMFDEELLSEIREKWMVKKFELGVSYTLQEPEASDPSMGQAQSVMDILGNKRNGFFIEAGAYDGETRSNTLVLERFLGWSGILIEPDPINFTKMLNKNREARMSPSCLSIKPYPMNVSFLLARNIGRIHDPDNSKASFRSEDQQTDVAHTGRHIQVQCFPLASYIAALGVKTVDYFSLDVEGSEMQVLESIPFESVDIRTLSVEYIHANKSRRHMIDFMEKRGYYVYSFVVRPNNLANDIVFAKKDT